MMKKLLILFLVLLGTASTSQAAMVQFEVDGVIANLDGSYTVTPGDTITINLIADTACNGWEIYGVAEVDESGNQAIITYAGAASNLQANVAASVGDAGTVDNYQGALFSGPSAYFEGALAAGEVIMSFDYTIASDWDGSVAITIAPLESGKTYTHDGGSFTVGTSYANLGTDGEIAISSPLVLTPEPTTIALLGFGCMMLVRRKRAKVSSK